MVLQRTSGSCEGGNTEKMEDGLGVAHREEILQLASVGANPNVKLEQGAFPNDYIQSTGQTIGGVWYYVYDIEQAADMLHDFIYDDIPFEYYGLMEEEIAALESGTATGGTEGKNVE